MTAAKWALWLACVLLSDLAVIAVMAWLGAFS